MQARRAAELPPSHGARDSTPIDADEETRRPIRGARRAIRQDEDIPLAEVSWLRDNLTLRLAAHAARGEAGDIESRRTLRRLLPLLDHVRRECAIREKEAADIGELLRHASDQSMQARPS